MGSTIPSDFVYQFHQTCRTKFGLPIGRVVVIDRRLLMSYNAQMGEMWERPETGPTSIRYYGEMI